MKRVVWFLALALASPAAAQFTPSLSRAVEADNATAAKCAELREKDPSKGKDCKSNFQRLDEKLPGWRWIVGAFVLALLLSPVLKAFLLRRNDDT